jgi:hypothetical protein
MIDREEEMLREETARRIKQRKKYRRRGIAFIPMVFLVPEDCMEPYGQDAALEEIDR